MKQISEKQIKDLMSHLDSMTKLVDDLPAIPNQDKIENSGVSIPGIILKLMKYNDQYEVLKSQGSIRKYFGIKDRFTFDHFSEIIDENYYGLFLKNLSVAISNQTEVRTDYRFVIQDSSYRWYEIIMLPIEEEKNTINLVILENTARKELEERERVMSEMDKSASLKSLVSCIAHEINNPNHNIMQNISLLENGWEDIIAVLDEYASEKGDFKIKNVQYSKIRKYLTQLLGKILNSSRQIKDIIDDLRRFSQKSQNLMSDEINLNYLVEKTVDLIRQEIHNATENFKVMYSTEMVPVLGNYNQLQQVLLNLVHNSIEGLENHSQEIKIFTFFNQEEKYVGVGVSDQGRGIDRENLKHIFEHFYNIRLGKSGGGLGLPISKEIIDLHNGKIKINSIKGNGTTVLFQLPVNVRRNI